MEYNQLLNDIILLVRGSSLPTKEEIEQMSFEEKSKLENDQDQIIQLFHQQALLDIWQLKIKISKLVKEASEIKLQITQNKEFYKQKTQKVEKTIKTQLKSETTPKEKPPKIQSQNKETEKNVQKNRPTLRINSQLNDKSKDEVKPENNIKYLKPDRKSKVRKLVKKNPRLEIFNLRSKDKENTKKEKEKNVPKYPFSVEQTNIESNKYSSLVSSLNPKQLILAEMQSQKDSNQNPKNEKNSCKSKNKSKTLTKSIDNSNKDADNLDTNQSKPIRRKPTPRRQPKKDINNKNNT